MYQHSAFNITSEILQRKAEPFFFTFWKHSKPLQFRDVQFLDVCLIIVKTSVCTVCSVDVLISFLSSSFLFCTEFHLFLAKFLPAPCFYLYTNFSVLGSLCHFSLFFKKGSLATCPLLSFGVCFLDQLSLFLLRIKHPCLALPLG